MSLSAGARLGPYEILSALGTGGMGEVYRARDTKLNRDVAIKVLLPAVANDPDRLARFSREAQVLASLNHPNIAHIHGLEEANGITALVLELVEGEDLAQRIARGPIPVDEALPIARQIAEALEAAHDHGIIHRDLKPANIKVRADGTVKVLDFGLAKAVDPAGGSSATAMNSPTLSIHATQAGIILGTAAYMSPEQARGRAVDKRTDIWALGCVLFEMLTGARAFPGDDATDTIVAVVSKEPDWNALPPSIPPGIHKLLRRSLEKDPKRRLDSAAAVRIEIDDALGLTNLSNLSNPPNLWRRMLPWSVAAALAVALAAVSVAYVRQHPPADAVVRFTVPTPLGFTRPEGYSLALSPDGQTLAFTALGPDGITRILTRRLDQTELQTVAGSEGGSQPFWSPDSRALAFAKEDALYRTDLGGGAPRRLCDVPGGTPSSSQAKFGSWSASGIIVFSARRAGLSKVADTGGTPTPVTTLDGATNEVQHASPWFLPDGRHVLFLALAAGQLNGGIWVTSIDDPGRMRVAESWGGAEYADGWLLTTTTTPRRLMAQRFDPDRLTTAGAPQPVRDRLMGSGTNGQSGFSVSSGRTLVVDRPPPSIRRLTWVDRAGRPLGTIGPAADIREFSLAADDRRVVATVTGVESRTNDLWLFDPDRGDGTRLTFEGGNRRPLWARNGRHVYFTGFSNAFELRTLPLGGAAPERFDNPGTFQHFEDLTRDGRYLIFKTLSQPAAIWIQRVGDPAERRALVQGQFTATQPRVSPDGRWLAYTLALPSGPAIFVQPFDRAGERVQVSRAGGTGAIWRADSRELYYESGDAWMAATMTERGGSLEVGTPERLFSLHTQGYVGNQPHNVEVAADGPRFLVNMVVGDSDNAPLEVTLNWTAALKK